MYLAKEGNPNSDAYAKLDLPASPWELWDALDKVRLQKEDILYMEIEDYFAFEYLSPHLDGLDISLNELNDLAAQLAALDEVQEVAFDGFLRMEVQNKVDTNGGVITLQDLRDLAVSAKTDCYHVVDAADDAQLGRFYAENEFVPELDGITDEVFEMLDFAGIGRMMRCSENGVFVGSLYVLQDGELTTAPPVQKTLPEKPGYLFRLTLGLHPDIGGNRTTELDLPASEEALAAAQEQLGTLNWENTVVLNYDGILPNAAFFADLPSELEAFNEFAKAVQDMSSPEKQLPKLKALLEQFEVQDIATAISLTECLDDYVLTPEISSPQETAIDQLHFMTDDHSVELLLSHVNLYAYGCDLIKEDNAVLSPYGLLHRADYQPIFTIENGSRELELVREENGKVVNSVVHTLTRDSENERQRIDQIALVDICLRFNPDILVVGEMRGAEANAAQEAARVGVAVLTTIHSNSCEATYRRMVSLCKRAVDMSDETLLSYVTEAYPIVVFCKQLENKQRRMMEIMECEILPNGDRRYNTLFRYVITENHMENGKFVIEGHHTQVNEISASLRKRLLENGMPNEELQALLNPKKEVNAT